MAAEAIVEVKGIDKTYDGGVEALRTSTSKSLAESSALF